MNRSRLVSIAREHILRALFPLAVTLLFLLVFIDVIAGLQRINPFPEGGAVHSQYENSAGWLVLIPAALAAVQLLRR